MSQTLQMTLHRIFARPAFTAILLMIVHLIVIFIATTINIAGLHFLAGHTIASNPYIILISYGIAVATTHLVHRRHFQTSRWQRVSASALTTLIIVTSGWVSGKFYDKSWDGMAYHQIGIVKMSEGWNPYFEVLPSQLQSSKHFDRKVDLMLWVNHYSKGMEVFGAAVFSFTRNIEVGKMINILLLISAFCSTLYFLTRLDKLHWAWNILIAAVASLNPVVINQLFSYYLDGALASCVLIIITQLALLFIDTHRTQYWLICACIGFTSITLVNLKFTGLIYTLWIGAAFLILVVLTKRKYLLKPFVTTMTIFGFIAIVIGGFNPYITNTVNHQHPFYPLAGNSSVDAIVHMVPPPLRNHGAIEKFIASTFSRCDNLSEGSESGIYYKVPLTVSGHELKVLQSEAIRLSGFGVFWSGIFVASLIAFIFIAVSRNRWKLLILLVVVALIGSVAINPVAWWARFVPQLWLFPTLVFFYLLIASANGKLRQVSKAVIMLMLINSAIIAGVYFYSVHANTKNANEVFAKIKASGNPVLLYTDIFSPNELKLKYLDIPYTKVNSLDEMDCSDPVVVLKMDLCTSSASPVRNVEYSE